MQGEITLRATDSKKEFTVVLKHRISILTGYSGLGKSKLIDFNINIWSNIYALDGSHNKVEVTRINNIDLFKIPHMYNDNKVLLVDEYTFACAVAIPDLLENFFKKCTLSYILIVARDLGTATINKHSDGVSNNPNVVKSIVGTKHYPISTDAIYTFKREKIKKRTHLKNVEYIPYSNDSKKINGLCVTEDTKLGRKLARQVLRNRNAVIDETYTGGKDKIIEEAVEKSHDSVIVVDGAVFALELFHLANIGGILSHKILAYMPISLEHSILGAAFLQKVMRQIKIADILKKSVEHRSNIYRDFIELLGEKVATTNLTKSLQFIYENYILFANESYSLERFFTAMIGIVTMEIYEKGYNKTNLPCFENQCTNCIEKKHCRYANKLGNLSDRLNDLDRTYERLRSLFSLKI